MSQRTKEQNDAMHLYFRWLAEALAEKHFDFRELKVEIQPTPHLVKELMWKPVQKAMYDKISTKTLETSEVGSIYDTLNKALIERFDVAVGFPNKEDLEHERAMKAGEYKND